MGHAATQGEKDAAEDFLRWAGLHEGVVVRRVDENNAEVGFNSPCRHLKFNERGKAFCEIYEDRPEICKNFPGSPNMNCPGFWFEEDSEEESPEKEEYDEQS